MNRNQAIALAIAAGNLVVMLLFPPVDVYSLAKSQLPVFGGFQYAFGRDPFTVVNSGMLALEAIVILVNASIAWLLLQPRRTYGRRRIGYQNATLIAVAVNLVLLVLFPPFESVYAVTQATLPTFEGFYLIFARQPNHVIVTPILYLEVIFVLVNGALFWLLFREKAPEAVTAEEAQALMREIRKRGG
jgi:hypothetical protein